MDENEIYGIKEAKRNWVIVGAIVVASILFLLAYSAWMV